MIETTAYSDILLDANQAIGGDVDGPSVEIAAALNRWINRRLRFAWYYDLWPDLRTIEKRQFRADWAIGTTYAATSLGTPVEVYYRPAETYYQALKASTGEYPATWNGSEWVENSAYWAECAAEYSDSDWAESTVYAVGDIVRNAVGAGADFEYYQCITVHTSGTVWATHAAKFAILVPFIRSIAFNQSWENQIGLIHSRSCYAKDPRIYSQPWLSINIFPDYFTVYTDLNEVWVDYHAAFRRLEGSAWATGAYAVGAKVYYDTTGDYYECIATVATEAPTDTGHWERLVIPAVLADYVAQGAAADYLGKAERRLPEYGTAEDEAYFLLERELDKLTRQQGQNRTTTIVRAYA